MDILLSLQVFSLYFYLFKDFLDFLFIETRGYSLGFESSLGMRIHYKDGNENGGQNPKWRWGRGHVPASMDTHCHP